MGGLIDVLIPEAGQLWRAALIGLVALVALLLEAAPMGTGASALPSPDLMLLVLGVAVVRRPDCVPIPLVFTLGLARDLIGDMPVGLGALTLIAAIEILRMRAPALSRAALWLEGMTIAAVTLAMLAAQIVLMLIMLAQPPYLMDLVRQWVLTLAFWPLAVFVVRGVMGIRAAKTSAGASTGERYGP
ncbi:MAG: hypothetical protein AAF899_02125 [Pseudomonadota bacterium]